MTREEVLLANVPAGSRFKGHETLLARELVMSAELVRYRRARWPTPEGKTVIAPLPEALLGGFGANLRRFCLVLHAQGQVTTERLTMEISKRKVVRIDQRSGGFRGGGSGSPADRAGVSALCKRG